MSVDDKDFDYVARWPDMPGFGAACVDWPELRKETAKTIAGWIKRGAIIERVHRDEASKGLREYVEEKRRREDAAKQPQLFSLSTSP